MAETVGFEPTGATSQGCPVGFRIRCLRPLGHVSANNAALGAPLWSAADPTASATFLQPGIDPQSHLIRKGYFQDGRAFLGSLHPLLAIQLIRDVNITKAWYSCLTAKPEALLLSWDDAWRNRLRSRPRGP
jgi:hypothetical protein